MIQAVQNLNTTLQHKVPLYKATNDRASQLYKFSQEKMLALYVIVQTQLSALNNYKAKILEISTDIKAGAQNILQKRIDQTLSALQKMIPHDRTQTSQIEIKSTKNRVKTIIVRLNSLMLVYGENARKYTKDMLKNTRQQFIYFAMPIYITLKATVLVTREMMMEAIQNRFATMKITYETSKDNITMFIKGNFEGNDIKEKISEGLKVFKNYTIEVAQKGLEIKVDKQSLFQNYDVFSLKFLQGVQSMKKIGSENIVSIKQRSRDMYQQIVNRIRQKQIEIKVQYRDYLQNEKEKGLQSHSE